jgi:hypothetical protein
VHPLKEDPPFRAAEVSGQDTRRIAAERQGRRFRRRRTIPHVQGDGERAAQGPEVDFLSFLMRSRPGVDRWRFYGCEPHNPPKERRWISVNREAGLADPYSKSIGS